MTEHDKLKEDYRKLNESYDKLTDAYNTERSLNDELIDINRKVAAASNETAKTFLKFESENLRMKKVLKHGVFFEYDEPKSMEYCPIMGDLTTFRQKKPSRLNYTFTFEQINTWLNELHEIMQGKNINKANPEDLK